MPRRNQRKIFIIEGEERKRWKNELKGLSLGYKKNIILIYSLGDVLNFTPTFLITLHIFRCPSVIPSKMHLMHRLLKFAPSIGDFVNNLTHQQMTDELYSVGKSVGDCGISNNCFWILCEMPTDFIPSVKTLVIVAFQVIVSKLSVKCRWMLFRRYERR